MTTMTTPKGKSHELVPVEHDPEVVRAREQVAALQEEARTLLAEDRQIGHRLSVDRLATDPMRDATPAERIVLTDRREVVTKRRRALAGELETAVASLADARELAHAERVASARDRVRAKAGAVWIALETAATAQKELDAEVRAVNAHLGRVTFNAMGWPSLGEEVASRRSQGWPS